VHEALAPLLDRHSDAQVDAVHGREDACPLLAERDALDTESLRDTYLSPAANPEIPFPEEPAPDEIPPERLTIPPLEAGHSHSGPAPPEPDHPGDRGNSPSRTCCPILALCRGAITTLEVFNLRVHEETGRDSSEILELLAVLNTGNVVALKRLIHRVADRLEGSGADPAKVTRVRNLATDIAALAAAYRKKPLAARIGTDSSGQSTRHHGMGLVVRDTLPGRAGRVLDKAARHAVQGQPSQRQAIPVGVVVTPQINALPEEFTSPVTARFFRFPAQPARFAPGRLPHDPQMGGTALLQGQRDNRQHFHFGRHPAQGQCPVPGRGHGRPTAAAPALALPQAPRFKNALKIPRRFRRGRGLVRLGQCLVGAGLAGAGDLVWHHGAAQRHPVRARTRRLAAQSAAVLEGLRAPGSRLPIPCFSPDFPCPCSISWSRP